MNTPVLTFFNNKGGVGKTSLIYHLAWMFAALQKKVVIVDLDPQANLTAAFLNEDQIEQLWETPAIGTTIYHCLQPLMGVGDIANPVLQHVAANLYLLPGDVNLSAFEDSLSGEWPDSMADRNLYRPLRILSSFWQLTQRAAQQVQADLVLVDIGPNLGAINRSALIATDYVAIPLGADLFSLQGLKNLGPCLRDWQKAWKKRVENWQDNKEKALHPDFELPQGRMQAIGYLCQQHSVRLDRPVQAYDKWVQRIPAVYRKSVLDLDESTDNIVRQEDDPYCLATIKHYRSLVPMAQERRKPIFNLSSADGAIGSHFAAVQDAKKDFKTLAIKIGNKIGLDM